MHLQYRLDQLGVYEVRYTMREGLTPDSQVLVQPAWTRIEIRAGGPQERARWLAEMAAHAPADATSLLSDYLPSMLGTAPRRMNRGVRRSPAIIGPMGWAAKLSSGEMTPG